MNDTDVPRNLFEVDNARYISIDDVVNTFIPTYSFWRLLSAKNHVVLGARGSGKTAVLRMLSHDHLSIWDNTRARDFIKEKKFIGVYVPTKAAWTGSLRNKPWQTEDEKEHYFCWRLNVSACIALVDTLSSCLNSYITDQFEKASTEIRICRELSMAWFGTETKVDQFFQLTRLIESTDFERQKLFREARARGEDGTWRSVGVVFDMELFAPLQHGISIASALLEIPKTSVWMLCLDETETLDIGQQRILNSHLRSHSGNLVFKLSTTPYGHRTFETNIAAPLNVGHDFEYVYIDQDPEATASRKKLTFDFETKLFLKRAARSDGAVRLAEPQELLGPSRLLDNKARVGGVAADGFMAKLALVADPKLFERAQKLLASDRQKFGNEIYRKVLGALTLRSEVARTKGRSELDVYSGVSMVMRCTDANPRSMLRLFNKLLHEGGWQGKNREGEHVIQIKSVVQSRILRSFSVSTLNRIQSEPEYGPEIYSLIRSIGQYMRFVLHSRPLTSDQISSIEIDISIPDRQWEVIKEAVGIGLLYPNVNYSNPDAMPERSGVFHLGYILAPCFELLPRRGKSRSLSSILAYPASAVDQFALEV